MKHSTFHYSCTYEDTDTKIMTWAVCIDAGTLQRGYGPAGFYLCRPNQTAERAVLAAGCSLDKQPSTHCTGR